MFAGRILGAVLLSTTAALPALAQNFCQMAGSKISLDFDVRPSLVVNSDAILDTTFADAGLSGGDPTERLFSFKHTIGAILESAQAPNTAASREAFVETMLDTFSSTNTFALNQQAGVLVPIDGRSGEATELNAAGLLDETDTSASAIGMRPLALFNRFDLAPENWSHCGEHRIVYGKVNPGFPRRFLLIFEAAVPNPDPAAGEAGCRPIAEFWAGLSGSGAGSDTEIARKLHAFFYEGKTDPSLTRADLLGPVVDFRNYGGDGNRGQVRANTFMQQPWQLREWLTQLTFDPNQPIAFVTDTVKDNPIAELYEDDLAGTAILSANVGAAVTVLHGDYVQALSTTIRDGLISEESAKHQTLKHGLDKFDLGSSPVDESQVLLNTIALGNDNRFNEHQSTSQPGVPPSDDIKQHAPLGSALHTVLGHLTSAPSPFLNPQSAEVFLGRAQAGTCAGCHMLSPGAVVRIDAAGMPEVNWPDVATGGFVHVREEDRALSPALETSFLPFRRYVLGRHLCLQLTPTPAAGAAVAAADDAPFMAGESDSMRFVDGIVADFLAGGAAAEAPAAPGAQPESVMDSIGRLSPADRRILRQRVQAEIAQARASELQRPGAFVEVRRPH